MATPYELLNKDNSRKCLFTIGLLCCILAFTIGCVILTFRIRYDIKQYQTLKKISKNAIQTKCLLENFYSIDSDCSIWSFSRKDCSECPCYGGAYQVKYQLTNQSFIQSRIHTESAIIQRDKQLKTEHPCFYDKMNVTHIVWKRESFESNLRSIIYAFVALGIMIIFFIFTLVRLFQP